MLSLAAAVLDLRDPSPWLVTALLLTAIGLAVVGLVLGLRHWPVTGDRIPAG
jgi:hypothetical protein